MSGEIKQVNIYIAKRGRDEHFYNCLYYLNEASRLSKRKYIITVFVAEDVETLNYSSLLCPNLKVIFRENITKGLFNKSELLNNCIEYGDQLDYEWFSIVDLDMIYPPNWFDTIEKMIWTEVDYIICHGWRLNHETQGKIDEHLAFEQLLQLPKEEFPVGPSQVTMSRRGYDTIKKYFPEPIYNEGFKGWGGEDDILDCKSKVLYSSGKLSRVDISQVWLHQWHLLDRGVLKEYSSNFKLYQELRDKITRMKF